MQFKPKSEEEVKRIFDKGNYNFKVISSVERNSKNGNPMIELSLQVDHNTIRGKTTVVKCFLLTDQPNFEFLLRHFCYSVGMGKEYELGNLEANRLIGKSGIVKIGIEVDDSGKYPDKNRVIDFIEQSDSNTNKTLSQDINDDIPF